MSSGSGNDDNGKTTAIAIQTGTVNIAAETPPCVVLMSGSAAHIGQQWNINKASVTMGRVPGNDIQVEEGGLSKAHATFTNLGDRVAITDLGATNKTRVNGKELAPNVPCPLKNNDQIQCGNLIFKFLQRGIFSETIEKERMQTELETARSVQANLLPSQLEARYRSAQIGGRYRPASETGGDWWWHWACGERAFAIIADATGHGAGAALITGAARSAVAILEDDPAVNVEKVYSTLSRALRKSAAGSITMSAFIVEIEFTSGKLRFINASHLPAVLLPAVAGEIKLSSLQFLGDHAAPSLGSAGEDFTVGELPMTPGSRLVLFTDGLTERKNSSGIPVNERAFYRILVDAHAVQAKNQKAFLDLMIQKSDEAAQKAPQDDDITVVAIDFLSDGA